MKVFEITNMKHSYHKIKGDQQRFDQNLGVKKLYQRYKPGEEPHPKNKLVQVLGHGVYSTAVAKSNKPDEVFKISRATHNLNEDPYYLYLSRIAAGKDTSENPFIPRIKQVKVYETDDKVHPYFYIVTMERLYHLELLDNEDLIKLITTLTKPRITNRLLASVGAYNAPEVLRQQSHRQLIVILVDKIREEKIKNPQLRDAMNIAASTGMEFDITPNNIMYRNTPNGVQLVLSDPVRN